MPFCPACQSAIFSTRAVDLFPWDKILSCLTCQPQMRTHFTWAEQEDRPSPASCSHTALWWDDDTITCNACSYSAPLVEIEGGMMANDVTAPLAMMLYFSYEALGERDPAPSTPVH